MTASQRLAVLTVDEHLMLERSGEWSVIWAPRSFARIVTAAVLISRLPKASKAHTANYQRTANVAGHTRKASLFERL